ncbi:MAG: hypothetical protein JXX29_09145 [Deltaproteobacteria bacterium]|nr:hypothetical protein [Deltaproteobacteria bacterium]MBN2671828.1 hypothetical protein [Deltaproteobacteria bacterium]
MGKKTAIVVACAFALSGCNIIEDMIADKVSEKVAEEVIENALENEGGGKADVDLSSGQVNVKTDKGSFSSGGNGEAKVPDSFPDDVTLPKNAKVRMAIDGESGINVTLESEETPDAIASFVKDDAKKNNWVQKSAADIGHAQLLVLEKDGRTLSVTVGSDKQGKSTMIMYNMQKAKK